MCGIVGIAGANEPVEPELITAMRDKLAHRGPDAQGLAFSRDGTTGFGHTRLAIIDPSPNGHQPMANPRRSLLLTFNGEIYNFRNLRTALEGHGVIFTTQSDAEVLLKSFEHWGTKALDHLRGMFAFAVWNEDARECVLARDRLGIKPLYYAIQNGTLYFASEATALLDAPPFSRHVDPTAVCDFLTYGYVPAPRSIWRSIHKLEPGHYLVFRDGEARTVRYWSPSDHADADAVNGAGAEDLLASVDEAVRYCMVSDVPIGSFLSGGVDSSTVTALMARAASDPIRTFSIDFEGSTRSEAHYARLVADRYGTDHRERALGTAPTLEALRTVAAAYDEPVADESTLPTFAISEEVSRSIKVVLSGDGGDEVFAGYAWYRKAARLDELSQRFGGLAGSVQRLFEALPAAYRRSAAGATWSRRLALVSRVDLDSYFMLRGVVTPAERNAIFSPDIAAHADEDHLWAWRRHWRDDLPLVRRLQLLDLGTFLPDDILTKVDRASMHHALEVRVPLLDHRVVESALAISTDAMFRRAQGKRVWKTVARGLLPAAVINRPKQGFGLPRAEWEAAGMRDMISGRLCGGELAARDWLRPTSIGHWLEAPHGRIPNKIWALFTLDLFLEAHAVSG